MSECPGYVRMRRYKLRLARSARTAKNAPTYLALHEFDSDWLPVDELTKAAETPWGRRIVQSLTGKELYYFSLMASFGDITAKF